NYTNDHVKGWNPRLDGIVQAVATAKQTVKEREEARDRLLTAIEKIEPPEGSEQKETEELGQAVRTARELAKTTALDVEATERAMKIAEDLGEKIKEAARLRKEAHDTLDEELTQLADIDCLPGQQPKQDELRKAASDLLEPPITEDRNKLAREAIDALKTWQGETKQALEDLGGKEQAQAFCDAFGVDPDKMAELETQLGGHDAVVALLKKPGLAKVKEYATAFGGGTADPVKFAEMVTGFGSFDALQAAVDAVGSVEKLSALTVKGGLTPTAAKDMIEGLGGGFVAELLGSGNDPATAKALVTELGGELKNFGTIAKAAGLDAKPKALKALLDTGCKGNAKDFAALSTDTFKDTDDQKALKGLIETGGFGDAPDALGGFFANGLGGDGKNLKEFCTAFDTTEAREGLNFLLNDAGLKGGPGKISDDCLSALVTHGAGPVPTPPPPDQAKLQSEAMAKLCKGMKKSDAENLGKALTTGGLGTEPDVLGHLVGSGCAGDPTKLNGLPSALAADGTAMGNLDKLLKDGGFGTTARDSSATGIKPECLAHLVNPGCDGKPAELIKLLNAMGTTDLKNMKGVMSGGELGKHPEALGQLYQFGCLDDPNGAATGDKNPQVLKDMLGGFADPGGPAAFNELMVGGGFGDAGQEHRLGCVMRHAFTPKSGPNAGQQQGASLRDLHDGFGSANMGKLKNTLNALDAPVPYVLEGGTDKQPGMGLQNAIHAPGLAGDAKKIGTKFYPALDARAGHSSHSRDALIQNAASFEHESVATSTPSIAYGGRGRSVDVSMDHIASRHSRKFSDLQPSASAPLAPTTLLPVGMDENDLQSMVASALTDLEGRSLMRTRSRDFPLQRDARGRPIRDHRGRPQIDPFVSDNHVPVTGVPGVASCKVGQRLRFHTRPWSVEVTQVFPQTGAGLVTLSADDLTAMHNALQ
ncbi:MAG: hypothetical protein AB3N09_08960, partial [Tateyamaria sp.]